MPLEESLYPHDWFTKAQQDVRTVEILLQQLIEHIEGTTGAPSELSPA